MSEVEVDAHRHWDWRAIKQVTALVAALTALLTAVVAILKPQDETMTKASYEELRKAVTDLSSASTQNHDDIVALRSYLLGYANAATGEPMSPPNAGKPITFVDAGPIITIKPKSEPELPPPPPPPAMPLPTVHAKPMVHALPDYDSLK